MDARSRGMIIMRNVQPHKEGKPPTLPKVDGFPGAVGTAQGAGSENTERVPYGSDPCAVCPALTAIPQVLGCITG